jgi:hypothetical protein
MSAKTNDAEFAIIGWCLSGSFGKRAESEN